MIIVGGAFIIPGRFYLLTLIASLVGVTALIFVAKGDVWGQILTITFSILYGIISFKFRYYGEMITYVCMSAPIALLSIISWLRNPYKGTSEVTVQNLNIKQKILMIVLSIFITIGFYYVLDYFNTKNLIISSISISTSFIASYLMFYRSSGYALAYAINDIVLIVLWVLASLTDSSYLPMVACFIMFLINDIYGFINWRKMKKRQELNLLRKSA